MSKKGLNKETAGEPVPVGDLAGLVRYLKFDLVSGLLVFLIALPLCLGIAVASNFPAINGVFTAIAGGIICSLLSNSELTIKGPAAGMIAIVSGACIEFASAAGVGADAMSTSDASVYLKYLPCVAAVAVVSGVIQIILGVCKAGALADAFPTSVIHGLLASIGLIIIGKQMYPLLGLKGNTSPEAYEAYLDLPVHLPHFAWQVATIGVAGLLLLFLYPLLKKRFSVFRAVPAQLIILAVAIPAAAYLFQAFPGAKRSYEIIHDGHPAVQEVKSLLVKVPANIQALGQSFIFPAFQQIGTVLFWKWVLMFTLVGTLESLLSAKAVESLDPWKRRSNLNRDLTAVGVANTAVALIGGLPMISEIVRSSANKDYGAHTRWSNFFHGTFLLLSILFLPMLLNNIPFAALAAMLVYAGCRLAHYKEFLHMWEVGKEQLVVFLATIVGVLMTDLLIGVAIGIAVKILIHWLNGMSLRSMFHADLETIDRIDEDDLRVAVRKSLVFSNWLSVKGQLQRIGIQEGNNVTLDVSQAKLIDHTVMEKLHELETEFSASNLTLRVIGLENHRAFSSHSRSARKLSQP